MKLPSEPSPTAKVSSGPVPETPLRPDSGALTLADPETSLALEAAMQRVVS
jgi:hypothetical protein